MSSDSVPDTITASSTSDEVLAGVDLRDRSVVVTGASSGLGVETARALAAAGASVTLAVRDTDRGEAVREQLEGRTGNPRLDVEQLDLGDLDSVRAFVERRQAPLDVLVANAGIMNLPARQLTSQGWEAQFGTNHLGHFALALGLRDRLAAAAAAAGSPARVVVLSSSAHQLGGLDLDDVNFEHRPYDGWTAYGQSKTANVLFAVGAAARWQADGITVNAVHPGNIRTSLSRHTEMDPATVARFEAAEWKSVEQGAATSVLLAGSPTVDGVTGRYFEDARPAEVVAEPADHGVLAAALDPTTADALWDFSLEAVRRGVRRPARS
jgi:NAD(P)-dependent dehydrogenase (short-subunit alcohol dehydrogenase family)